MKIKPLSKEQLIISVDRLTRFKDPETKYLRVFKEIISTNLLEPKLKKKELDLLSYESLKNIAENIINSSLPQNKKENFLINQRLLDYENSVYKINENTQTLLKNKINYKEIIKILPDNIPNNLKWLKSLLADNVNDNFFGYPVQQLLLCEGITEEILLPEFAKICNYDFEHNGIHIISAGGKNQVVKYFYNFADTIKIPVFILLDKDAEENLKEILPRLREFDKIHLVKSGEFEDLLPDTLIIKTLKYATKNISLGSEYNIAQYNSKVEFLEEFFKHRGLHEFKKSEFALMVKENISDISDLSEEIIEIFKEIKGTKVPL